MEKIIAHLDMDAFYASVEIRDNPSLKGKPVLVGGSTKRGVVATCSYEARKYGIKSAMPVFIAKKKCPNCIIVKPDHSKYSKVSREIFKLIKDNITDKIEKISIDEGYLDLSEYKSDYLKRMYDLKYHIKKNIGITCSLGISYNKFLAKIASDWNKPDGLKVIKPDMIPEILKPLNINKVHGIGQKSKEALNNIGIYTIGDLLLLNKEYMVEIFGKHGVEIYDRIHGIDNRRVEYESKSSKSIGRETTLKEDTNNKEYLSKILKEFTNKIIKNLVEEELIYKTITVKYKTENFTSHTKSRTLNLYNADKNILYNEAVKILSSIKLDEKIRLIGLSVSNLSPIGEKQISFFEKY